MYGIADGKHAKRLGLQLRHLIPTMIHRARYKPIFPPRMLHLGQLDELSANLIGGQAFSREGSVAGHAGARWHEFMLEFAHGFSNLGGNAGANARKTEEEAIEVAACSFIGDGEGANKAMATELEEELASPAEKEEHEDDIAEATMALSGCIAVLQYTRSRKVRRIHVDITVEELSPTGRAPWRSP